MSSLHCTGQMAVRLHKKHLQLAWQRWMYMILMALVLPGSSTSSDLKTLGKMTPSDPKILSGTTLELNCTLNTLERGDASQIYFQYGTKREPKKYVHVLNNYTAQLRKPNMTRRAKNQGTHYFCYLPEKDFVGHQSVKVVDAPKKPRVTGCIVYNWERMTCWWEPAIQDTGMITNTTLYWSILQDLSHHCPHQNGNNCTWKHLDSHDSFRDDMTYHMYVAVANQLGRSDSEVCTQDTKIIVKPNKVADLKEAALENCSEDTGSTRKLCITWQSPTPEKLKTLIYLVSYKSEWKSQAETVNITNN